MACAIGWETFFFIFRGGGGGEVLPRRCRIMIPRPHVSNVEEQKKLSGKSCGHLVSFVLAFPRSGRLPFHAPSRPCQVLGRLGPLMDLFIHLIVVANNLGNPSPRRAALVSHGLSLGYCTMVAGRMGGRLINGQAHVTVTCFILRPMGG